VALSQETLEALDRLSPVLVLAVLALSAIAFTRLTRWSPLDQLRSRLLFGVPWGTLIVVAGLAGVYYLLQGGGRPGGPVATGFRSWSIWYPEGLLLSSFAHSSDGHLISNLTATLAFAPLVEYAWGHLGDGETGTKIGDGGTAARESDGRADGLRRARRLARPGARIGAFVLAVLAVGVAGSLFVPGAVIGFSGVVFAFAGVAIVAAPLGLILAMLGLQVLRLVRAAFESPVVLARAQETFISPSWADVAVQGHLFGLLVGVAVGVALVRHRGLEPDLRYVWFAALAFAVTRSLYALYWYQGGDSYLLFRGLGVAGVFVLAGLIAGAALATDRTLVPRIDLSARELSIGVVLAVVFALALVAIPYNLVTVSATDETADGIEIRDYTVSYAEGAQDRYIGSVGSLIGDAGSVRVSGVIVTSDRRNAWELAASRGELASRGQVAVPVGGAGWRELVVVNRTAWEFVDGNQTYTVTGRRVGADGGQRLFAAPGANSSVRIDNNTIGIRPAPEFYEIVVYENGTASAARIPAVNESVRVAGIGFERDGRVLIATQDGTRIPIARYRPKSST